METLNQGYLKTMFEGMADSFNKLFKLDAIHFGKYRIKAGDKVIVVGNFLLPSDKPTHTVIELYGNVTNTFFEVKALNLATGKEEIIKL